MCCGRTVGLLWCHVALGLVDYVLMPSFRPLVFPGVGWMIVMIAGFLGKVGARQWRSGTMHNSPLPPVPHLYVFYFKLFICICAPGCRHPQRPEEGVESPGAGVTR